MDHGRRYCRQRLHTPSMSFIVLAYTHCSNGKFWPMHDLNGPSLAWVSRCIVPWSWFLRAVTHILGFSSFILQHSILHSLRSHICLIGRVFETIRYLYLTPPGPNPSCLSNYLRGIVTTLWMRFQLNAPSRLFPIHPSMHICQECTTPGQ
jgi:hypothetical protein